MKRALVALLVLSSGFALAQVRSERPKVNVRVQVQEINIDDDELITGGTQGPDVVPIDGPGRAHFPSLIQVRTSFADKVMNSEAEIP